MNDEFPHTVVIKEYVSGIDDGMGGEKPPDWVEKEADFACFIDTPTAKEVYNAMQLNHKLDRYMYFPYRTDIMPGMRVIHDDTIFEIETKAEDQGGMHEIMRIALKEV